MAQMILSAAGNAIGGPIGGFIGGTIGGMIDNALFGKDQQLPDKIGPRLDNLKVQSSAYGQSIPQIFGYMRLGGNIIWAQNIKEVENRETTTQSGGKGGPEVSQTSITYTYFATLAIAICEGTVDEVVGVWADSKKLDARVIEEASGKYEVHLGAEDQAVSSIIESFEGVGNTSAYRGTCYVVIEDFPLADYGNRIPNFTFEVRRKIQFSPSVEDLVKDITMIPGSGEFVYSTEVHEKFAVVEDQLGNPVQSGKREKINMHNFDSTANVNLAIKQMKDTFPNLEWVSVVVNWFITSKNMATGEVIPKVEFPSTEAGVTPTDWEVAGITRENAELVLTFPDGTVTYGGTPSDHTLLQLCTALKAEGWNVLLYPMPLVDTVDETVGEDDKPWRGRLVPASAADCNSWFTKADGYNDFIRHYSQDSALMAQVDALVIGSELRGITTYDSGSNTYPGVDNLVALAALVAADAPSVSLTYAADWSEYHSVGGYYHLDSLWSSPHIDFIGIDNYMPLTPDLDQSQITQEKIKEGWESGEGWEYFYSDSEARTGKTDYVPSDGTSPFAWKNIEQFWDSAHFHNNDGVTATGWTAKMKPVWFTEFGFPSVDGAANQPNVFVDPTSVENFYPRGSKQRVDFLAQRDAVNATLEFWQAKNAETGKSDLVPRTFLWTWDARPYPFWPDLLDIWADGANWKTGHWVNGKFGISGLGAIVADLLTQVGLDPSDYDVSELDDTVEGLVLNQRATVRDHLEMLRSLYFFDVVESDGQLQFIKRGRSAAITVQEDDIVPESKDDIRNTVKMTRKQELDLPQQVDISYIDRISGYQASTQTALRYNVNAVDKVGLNAPILMAESEARSRAEKSLYSAWVARTLYEFTLPPKYADVEAGDVIDIVVNNITHSIRVASTTLSRGGSQQIQGLAENVSTYDFYIEPGQPTPNPQQGVILPETRLELLDLPRLPADAGDVGDLRMAVVGLGEGWRGAVVYHSHDGGESGGNTFSGIDTIQNEAVVGTLLSDLPAGPRNTWDFANTIHVALIEGSLFSSTELGVLNGANLIVVGDELIQFQNATLLGPNQYRLSKLLRGRLGTEHEMAGHTVGETIIFMDSAVKATPIAVNSFGLLKYYKGVTIGDTLGNTTEQSFSYTGKKFRPYSPVQVEGARDVSENLTITWKRRTRIDGEWRDGVDIPLGEESEAYDIEIKDGASVVRTLESTTPSVEYTAADQVTDFGSAQSSVDVVIYQKSAIFGRGVAAEATI